MIRKSLAVGTLGAVKGSSKKQRVAKQTMRAAQATAASTARMDQALASQAAADAQEREREKRFRYETDPQYRAFVDAERAEAQAAEERRAADRRAAAEVQAADRARRSERRRGAAKSLVVGTGQVAAFLVLVPIVAVVAVWVWVPQIAVSKVRHHELSLWSGESFRSASSSIRGWR